MIVSLSFGLILIAGLTQSLPYPQEIHIQNIDEIINASSSTNQSSPTLTTAHLTEIPPIEINSDNHEEHHHGDHQEKIDIPPSTQDNENSGRSLDSNAGRSLDSNSGLLTSIFLNPAVRPTEQSQILHDISMTTVSADESSSSSTDSEMLKVQNESMMMNDSMTKMNAENINHMEETQHTMNETDMTKDLNDGQNDQPIMDEDIIPENISENNNHNTEGYRKYTEINRDNQYLPMNRDNQYLPINHHNNDNQYLPINNHDQHQYTTVDSNVNHENSEIHQNHHHESDKESDEIDIHETHADIKESSEIRYDHTEMIMEATSTVTSNLHDNKSDNDNKMDLSKPQAQEPKPSSGNKLEIISKFGKITLLLYITFLCL